MNIFLSFDLEKIRKKVLIEILDKKGLEFELVSSGELVLPTSLDQDMLQELSEAFADYGITIVQDEKISLVIKIKEVILEIITGDETTRLFKVSTYLSEKLGFSYAHLAQTFSEVTHTSIENFIILKKIDYVKELLLYHNCSLTEIAHKMNYSSVAHLSNQFKKTTGLTPTFFKKIMEERNAKNHLTLTLENDRTPAKHSIG